MQLSQIDFNADLGEEMPNELALMPFISSANIACGAHAGNPQTMRQSIVWAIANEVAIGAHPAYPDRANFGRVVMEMEKKALYDLVISQLQTLADIAQQEGARLHHLKPHGALYNKAAKDTTTAEAIAEATYDFDPQLILYGLSGSQMIAVAQAKGLRTASEVFADRSYQDDGSLTPRNLPEAVLTDLEKVEKQVLQMVLHQSVTTQQNTIVTLSPQTICLHGDGKNATVLAQKIHEILSKHEIRIKTI